MRRKLVVGNWKMHGTKVSAGELVTDLKQQLSKQEACGVVVCPPMTLISHVADLLNGSAISWGAQNVHAQSEGAFTGEVSAQMLADVGCQYVIVGHSERRALFNEIDVDIAYKCVAAQRAGITPIICLGETLEQRDSGLAFATVEKQLLAILDVVGVQALSQAVLAYEPVWAIGTGKTATPELAQEIHFYIRQIIAVEDPLIAEQVQILYGGSVNAKNARELFLQNDIDGALVGGASLKAQEFLEIGRAASV